MLTTRSRGPDPRARRGRTRTRLREAIGAAALGTALGAAPLMAAAILPPAASPSAYAAASTMPAAGCDALLVDQAGALSSAEESAVAARAGAFRTDTGYEIRLRILTQDEAPLLDAWMDDEQARCQSWQTAQGGFRTNLVVLALTTDTSEQTGETGLYVGDDVPNLDDDTMADIRANVINPEVANGDYAEGLERGIAAVQKRINPGTSVGLVVFLVLLGLAVVIAIAVFLWRRQRDRQRRRDALTARFGAATNESDALVLQMDQAAESLDADLQLVPSVLESGEAAALVAPSADVRMRYAAVTNARSELMIGRDLLHRESNLVAVESVVRDWERLRDDSADVLPRLQQEQQRVATAMAAAQSVPARVGALDGDVAEIRALGETARADGFVVDTDLAVLATVPEAARRITALAGDRKLLTAAGELDDLETGLGRARDALGSMQKRAVSLGERAIVLAAEREQLGPLLAAADEAAVELQAAFPGVWAAEPRHEEEAHALVVEADAGLAAAARSLAAKDLGAGTQALDAATKALMRAQTGAQRVLNRLDASRKAASSVPARMAKAQADIAAIEAKRRTVTPVVTSQVEALSRLGGVLGAIALGPATDWIDADAKLTAVERELDELRTAVDRAAAALQASMRDRQRAAAAALVSSNNSGSGWWGGGSSSSSRRSWSSGSSRSSSSRSSSSGRSSGSRSGGSSSRSGGGRSGGSSRR